MFFEWAYFIIHRKKALTIAQKSMLWGLKNRDFSRGCPICGHSHLEQLIQFPIGWPMPQNHHLLYFDQSDDEFPSFIENRFLIEKTMGFLLSISWNYCLVCRNASLDTTFDRHHIMNYYSRYYRRRAPSSQKRQNTKEVYGRYLHQWLKRKSRILEIGSAEGYVANYLARQGHRIWAIEPSHTRSQLLVHENIFIESDIERLEPHSFDCVYLHHVFEHIIHPMDFLNKVYELLKKGGILFIQVPDLSSQMDGYLKSLRWCHYAFHNPIYYHREWIRNYFPKKKDSYKWMDALNNDHVSAFTPFGLEYILKRCHFSVQKVQSTTKDRLICDEKRYSWPIDRENGQTPNGLTLIAIK